MTDGFSRIHFGLDFSASVLDLRCPNDLSVLLVDQDDPRLPTARIDLDTKGSELRLDRHLEDDGKREHPPDGSLLPIQQPSGIGWSDGILRRLVPIHDENSVQPFLLIGETHPLGCPSGVKFTSTMCEELVKLRTLVPSLQNFIALNDRAWDW
jgi:hypothetical protein